MKFMMTLLLIFVYNMGHSPPLIELFILMPEEKGVPLITRVDNRMHDISMLHPLFRNKVVMLLYEAAKQGIELEVIETYRTPERQDFLRRRGVSMLRGGRSKHQHRLAVDVVPIAYGGYMWYDDEIWKKIGRIGINLGLIWGGNWQNFPDYPHFEYPVSLDSIDNLPIPDTILIPINYKN